MTSVFERALGPAYYELHPEVRRRYALTSADERRCVGRGRMRSVSHHPLARPVFRCLARRNVLFPETGTHVPFEVRTTPFRDVDGTETLAYVRAFDVGVTRRFDAYMTYDVDRQCVLDYVGSHRDLVVELHFDVTEEGGLLIRAGKQWLSLAGSPISVPSPLRVGIDVHERYDEGSERFEIDVAVRGPLLGIVFAYDGWFTAEYESCPKLGDIDAPAGWAGEK